MGRIYRIVLTGGPCAGKTTAIQKVKDYFLNRYLVLCIPESSTELMNGGVFPADFKNPADYMECQTKLQLLKEQIYDKAAEELVSLQDKDVVILLDRGLVDIKAYMSDHDFDSMLSHFNLTMDDMLFRYDFVFHLVSAAKDAPEFYTNTNNTIRKETVEEAAIIDDKTFQAWKNHEHFVLIEGYENFEEKCKLLISQIETSLD